MSNPQSTFLRTQALLNRYRKRLDGYSEAQIAQKLEADGWTIGQVYQHLIGASLHFQLRLAKECLDPATPNEGRPKLFARVALLLGMFPPVRIKVPPSPQYTPPQPESKAKLLQGLAQCENAMREVLPQLLAAEQTGTRPHPRFSHLNARQWYKLISMHFAHHERQLARLDALLKQQG